MTLAGTWPLAKHIVRRDRVRLALWLGGITALVIVTAISVRDLYPDPAALAKAQQLRSGNRALLAMSGPAIALDTLGGVTVFEMGAFGFAVVGLMNVFLVGRHSRGDEESGATELVRSLAVSPWSPFVAVLVVAGVVDSLLGLAIAASLVATGLPAAGSFAYAAAMATTGLCFAAVTLVLAQISPHTRAVQGAGAASIAIAFVLRAVGDVGDGRLSWASPIGWAQGVRAYGDERWWAVALLVVASCTLTATACVLATRRDVGAGLVQPRRGRAHSTAVLAHPTALALRLQRGALAGWAVGLVLGGAVYGSVADDIEQYVRDTPGVAAFFGSGDDVVDLYLGTILLWLALVGSGFAISSVLRLRSEETAGRTEAVLSTGVGRRRNAWGTLAVALGGATLLSALTGLGTGIAVTATSDRGVDLIARLAVASLVDLPAVWVLAGLAMLLVGARPRATAAAWAAMAFAMVVGLFAEVLDLPTAVRDLSPFEHLARAPAEDVAFAPLAVVLLVAVVLVVAGVECYARRDIG